jgi:hypothetical protein
LDQPNPSLDSLIDRPPDQRLREYKYRFAQTTIFGLPVLALQWIGPLLSRDDAARWVGLFQAILTGWIVYVAAAGMLFEGIVLLRRARITGGLIVGAIAVVMYLASAASVVRLLVARRLWFQPLLFHVVVIILAAWCALRWAMLSRRAGDRSNELSA